MDIKYLCTYWGSEDLSAKAFLDKVLSHGYDGVEINFPDNQHFVDEFMSELERIRKTSHPEFIFIAQQVLSNEKETLAAYKERLTNRLNFLISLNPNAINSHTGKDFFDFNSNVEILHLTEEMASKSGIPIWHEIHRGRFSFHLRTLLDYLNIFPNLKLIADLSHFCVVSESDLSDQHELLTQIYPNIQHIHARVGFEQSPQVNHPFAPEWKQHLDRYTSWWKEIIELQSQLGKTQFTITPEFGPFPYMPQAPFTESPLANQWELNTEMKRYLLENVKA
ncbi:MAG: sugar phosphate isomerase/epimerase [Crocinitomicaceae bacterium]|nr:sugar phosphate isomerase/epimerase [Crocinitomicaceae bacterium]MBP6032523.1 sugar phosphate isomerase/epimerase [Crocinitomicaceae bacterium]